MSLPGLGKIRKILTKELMLRVLIGYSATLFAIANSEIFIVEGFQELFQPIWVDRVTMRTDIDDEFAAGRFDAVIERTSKGEFFRSDVDDLRTITLGDGDSFIGRPRVHKEDLNITEILLANPLQQTTDVLVLVISADDY